MTIPTAIDVLIPVYNGAVTLVEAIATIQAQTHRELTIHVVDDGSTDETPALLAKIAHEDTRVRVHRQANSGIVDALNAGLAHCTAEFIARHDADDLAYPQRIAEQFAYLRAHPDTVAVGAAVRHIDGAGRPTGSVARLTIAEMLDPLWAPAKDPYLIHPFLMVRRSAVEAVGGYRHAYHAEDTDLYWRLAEVGRLYNMPELLGDYRMHEGSISGSSIVNGRIMALCSQLAALSAQRRRCGKADYIFDKAVIGRYKTAKTIAAMIEIAARGLDMQEREHLEVAVAGKLFDLTAYRPYELDSDDCRFICRAIKHGAFALDPLNQRALRSSTAGTAARLAYSGDYRAAFTLTPLTQLPGALIRYALRVALPVQARRWLRYRLTGEPGK